MGFDHEQATQNNTQHLRPFIITENSPLVARECAIVPCTQYQRFKLRSEDDSAVLIPEMHIIKEWDTYGIYNNPETDHLSVLINFTAADVNSSIPFPQDITSWGPIVGEEWYQSIRDWLRWYLTAVTFSTSSIISGESMFETVMGPTDITRHFSSNEPLMAMFNNSQTKSWRDHYCKVGNKTRPDVECAMHKVAAGITNAMRAQSWQDLPRNRMVAQGIAYKPRQIVYAQWQYISAPIAVWVLGVILFVGVVIKTRRANIKAWRTSPLATLLLRLDQDSREHLKDWQHLGDAELRDLAEQVRLRLRVDEGGPPRFVKKEERSQ
ncbi:hypothetical protein F5X68DRAFT_230400 [Plectosphaerella plurivora]|uniref:Uncharacterized protein n=1 Tax=Plectosphaerella plurivora TaxID=936078 RepID=A0A9P9AA20_9PEZI|nr:hypothetical protein F5X68DRAFT_230400 [Plectosphaerella plurivora]